MEQRIVRLEEGIWRIRTDAGELNESEQKELIECFGEIKLPYRLADGYLVPGREVLYPFNTNP